MSDMLEEKDIIEINRKLDAIIKFLGIDGEVRRSKKSIDEQMASKVLDLQKRRKNRKGAHGCETDRTR